MLVGDDYANKNWLDICFITNLTMIIILFTNLLHDTYLRGRLMRFITSNYFIEKISSLVEFSDLITIFLSEKIRISTGWIPIFYFNCFIFKGIGIIMFEIKILKNGVLV